MKRLHLTLAVLIAFLTGGPALPSGWSLETEQDARARLIAARGTVQYLAAASPNWELAVPFQDLYLRDSVRTQDQSRAAVLFFDETQVRLGPNARLTVEDRPEGGGSVLNLLSGEGWFRTKRADADLEVRTQAATAAIRGTEFGLRVEDDGATTITVVEGSMRFFNEAGSVDLNPGEEGFARPGEAPIKRVVIDPRDAVQWIIYYPFVPSYTDYPTTIMNPWDTTALERLEQGDPEGALSSLEGSNEAWSRILRSLAHLQRGSVSDARAALADPVPEAEPATFRAHRGLVHLVTGRPSDARLELEAALASQPENLWALCYLAFLELYQNETTLAAAHADQAVTAHPESHLANVTAGEVAQARFDLNRADQLFQAALRRDPRSLRAVVNRARIAFGRGRVQEAEALVDRASELAPEDASVASMHGFIVLSMGATDDARASFEKAVGAQPELGEAHLGLGLVAFQDDRQDDGLFHLLAATLVQPRVSLYQSYLAKAYYDLRRTQEALAVLDTAKILDEADPTPWLYESVVLRSEYRWAEALSALGQAIERNDNRAVYRSRSLLDQDEATKNVGQASIYNHFGFRAWGRHAARTSLRNDFANPSAHLLLSRIYGEDPDRTIAQRSEFLQYLLLAPVNRNTFASFKEYAVLFERPGIDFRPSLLVGYPLRFEAEYFSAGGTNQLAHQLFGILRAEESTRPGEIDLYPFVFGSAKFATGRNSDVLTRVEAYYDDQGDDEVTQVNLGSGEDAVRLLKIHDDPDENYEDRGVGFRGDLGFRHAFGPLSPLLAYIAYDYQASIGTDPDAVTTDPAFLVDYESGVAQSTVKLGVQQVVAPVSDHRLILGATGRYVDTIFDQEKALYDATNPSVILATDSFVRSSQAAGVTGYAYYSLPLGAYVTVTPGFRAQYDEVESELEDRVDTYATVDPALGLGIRVTPRTTFRAAAFKRLQETRLNYDLAPTAIEGFPFDLNQVSRFTNRWEFGAALEHMLGRLYVENAWTGRFYNYPRDEISLLEEATEYELDSSLNWLVTDNLGLTVENAIRRYETDPFVLVDDQVRAAAVVSLPVGIRLELNNTFIYQTFPKTVHDELVASSAYLLGAEARFQLHEKVDLTLTGANLLASPIDVFLVGLPAENLEPFARVGLRVEAQW